MAATKEKTHLPGLPETFTSDIGHANLPVVNGGQVAAVAVVVLLGTIALIVFLVQSQRRRTVIANSVALGALQTLNQGYQQRLMYAGPIVYNWDDRVDSKAKFDRYDLHKFFMANLAAFEAPIHAQLEAQTRDASLFTEYHSAYLQLGAANLGRSTCSQMNPQAFARIEQRLFTKGMLRAPLCVAQVRCTIRYTSPQGRNSYARDLGWNFDQLRAGLAEMRQLRTTQSTATFLRQQERNRMSASLRYQVLKRDNSRCTRCGATPQAHGVSLHVDHITPVSKGGKTEMSNLQTLCESCNLGKSHRY